MARHIVAVCVVCLLCADRLPCEQHIDENFGISGKSSGGFYSNQIQDDFKDQTTTTSGRDNSLERLLQSTNIYNKRRKRHAGHGHEEAHNFVSFSQNVLSEKFLQRIFEEYGHEDGTIHYDDFRRMLKRLGLNRMLNENYQKQQQQEQQEQKEKVLENEGKFKETLTKDNGTCIKDTTLIQHLQHHQYKQRPQKDHEHEHDHNHDHNHEHEHGHDHGKEDLSEMRKKTLCKQRLCSKGTCKEEADDDSTPYNYTLSQADLLSLCPVLLYQLSSNKEEEKSGCLESSLLEAIDCSVLDLEESYDETVYKWCYAFMSVLACSVLGLVGVGIIPFMDTRFYKHIIQFFVALAVGTMTGDALLHLMPHAVAGQDERNMIFKGLTCMGGIVFFYITEHGLTMISEWRRRIEKQEKKKPSRAKIMHDADSTIHNSQGGDKLCKSKYSSYPYCYDEIAMAIKKDDKPHQAAQLNQAHDYPINCSKRNSKVEPDCSETSAATQSLLGNAQTNHGGNLEISGIAFLQGTHNQRSLNQCLEHVVHDNTIATDIDGNAIGDAKSILANGSGAGGDAKDLKPSSLENKANETVTVILREHESTHHGHSHKHGHVHSPPTSLSSVAWMIIMGDGLHNFTDGMAIGAAFAENIAGGFSTSLAVFCHELPHELGDFAILIKAGMTVRSAVYYNLMTGILSFIGMFVGMIFGQSQASAQWMFAAAAGLFIYIALVDMLPELSTPHKSIKQLVLQILGMLSGIFIMLLIAIYEGDLMTVFASPRATQTHSYTAATHQGY